MHIKILLEYKGGNATSLTNFVLDSIPQFESAIHASAEQFATNVRPGA
jgi:hypothetical protein